MSCGASGLHFTNRLLAAVLKLSGAGELCDIHHKTLGLDETAAPVLPGTSRNP